jgi:phosphopantothenoylcysteine decarboxylase
MKILIGLTGSVACTKIYDLINAMQHIPNLEIKIISTQASLLFIDVTKIKYKVYTNNDEYTPYTKGKVLHVELRNWADLFLIAPLDANSLGKISTGICDNLLLCVCRCWDFDKPIIVAPAMNTKMYLHPVTSKQFAILKEWGYLIIDAIEKTLACGDVGIGAMQDPVNIVKFVEEVLKI